MGNIFFPFERRNLRQKIYLGHGYWIFRYDEGPDELRYVRLPHTIPLSKIKDFDRNGYPKLKWKGKPFLFLDELAHGGLYDEPTKTDEDETE